MMNICESIYVYVIICIYIWFPVLSICLLCHFATFEPKLSNLQKSFQLPKLRLLFHLKVDFFTEIQTLKILPKISPQENLPILRRFCRTCKKNLSHLLAFQALSQLPPQCHFTSAGARHTANEAAEL